MKTTVAGPITAKSSDQALGFYISVVLKKAVEYRRLKDTYRALDTDEIEKLRQREQEQASQQAADEETERRQANQVLFESHECVCGRFVEIEPGVPEPECSVCGGYVTANAIPIAV